MRGMQGSINHIAITVSSLDEAMRFFGPFLDFLGYTYHERGENSGTRLALNLNPDNNIAINIWEAKGELAAQKFEIYAPGLHHIAFNADSAKRVDEMAELVKSLGGEILDGPGEFPFAKDGYYAVYFLGPDRMKFEYVYMPELLEQFS